MNGLPNSNWRPFRRVTDSLETASDLATTLNYIFKYGSFADVYWASHLTIDLFSREDGLTDISGYQDMLANTQKHVSLKLANRINSSWLDTLMS